MRVYLLYITLIINSLLLPSKKNGNRKKGIPKIVFERTVEKEKQM